MDNKMMIILEDIKSLVKVNIEGQKAFEERFETRLSNIENEMWSDLIAREYGRMRMDIELLKEEVSFLSQNA
ncbi:MAG: hypothetical protein PHS52_07955 [Desulfotomaculaceae bacterium]|nr:hypothetical protein [Desulfotomaculaceae bacterium]